MIKETNCVPYQEPILYSSGSKHLVAGEHYNNTVTEDPKVSAQDPNYLLRLLYIKVSSQTTHEIDFN